MVFASIWNFFLTSSVGKSGAKESSHQKKTENGSVAISVYLSQQGPTNKLSEAFCTEKLEGKVFCWCFHTKFTSTTSNFVFFFFIKIDITKVKIGKEITSYQFNSHSKIQSKYLHLSSWHMASGKYSVWSFKFCRELVSVFTYKKAPEQHAFLDLYLAWLISRKQFYFILSLADKLQDGLTPKEVVSGKRARKTAKK